MIAVGSSIGNYQVKSPLGEGGMGIVWLAEHPLIGRRVAIKVIHPTYARNPEAVSRFFTEAQAVNTIGHPNIVDITDFGQTPDGECYFVMEYLDGQALSARLREGSMDLRRGLHVAAQVCDALAASHAAGILHRDLKPDNIFLIRRGQDPDVAKVLDFGLAKLTTGDQKSQHKTRTGSMMGTPYYMAPEQCAGKADIDSRADVYALGVILFEMVTGRVPFPGEGYGEIIVQHITQPAPKARELNPHVPEWLEALIDRCLVKDRDQRVQSMAELRDALMAQLEQMPGGVPTARASTSAGGSNPPVMTKTPPPGAVPPISTMTLASGEAAASSGFDGAPRRKIGLYVGVGVAALAGAAVLALTLGGKKSQPTAAAAPVPGLVAAPPAAGASAVASTPPDAAAAGLGAQTPPAELKVQIDLSSDPAGARVTLADGTVVCAQTPCTWSTFKTDAPAELTFSKSGYVTRKRSVSRSGSAAVDTALVADKGAHVRSSGGSRGSGRTGPSGDKPQGSGASGDKPQGSDRDGVLKPSF
jgi:serine/threonine-protein kinase